MRRVCRWLALWVAVMIGGHSLLATAAAEALLGPSASNSFMQALRDDAQPSVIVEQRPLVIPAPSATPAVEPPPPSMPDATPAAERIIADTDELPRGVPYPFDPQPHWYDNQGCVATQPWYRIYEGSNFGLPCYQQDRQHAGFLIDGVVRGYYHNDQRIQWSGQEATFGAEGVLSPRLVQHADEWTVSATSVLFLNQPFDRNRLNDPSRAPYGANFQRDVLEVWNLNVTVEYDDWRVVFGKQPTPFGRHYAPLQTNARFDAPFIRTEAIGWNEVGIFVHHKPGPWVADFGIVNGTEDLDTNSDKGAVARLGLQADNFAAGVSGKIQDGLGSEFQKRYDNQYGFDLLVTRGNWDVSSEMIYDEYGYRKPEINLVPYTWKRSNYYRDIYNGQVNGRLSGLGYYFNIGYTQPRYRLDLNYGEYYPRAIGNPLHDPMNRRFIVKGTFLLLPRFESLVALIFENSRPVEAFRAHERPFALFTGAQTYF